MRNSKQRSLILQIINQSNIHPTAEEIYNECRKQMPNISLGTVYRNLNMLVNLNSIERIRAIDGMDHFDKKVEHSHFICQKCGKIIDIYELILPKYETVLGHQITNQTTIFKGICIDCQK